jgi:hypothetical protein
LLSPKIKTRAAALAALLLAVGCRREPRAPQKLAAGADNHGFVLDRAHDRVLFLRGEYPNKTYLCAAPLGSGGRGAALRLPGFSLIGAPFALRDGRVLVSARRVSDSDMDLAAAAVLKVDLETGKIAASYDLGSAVVRLFAQPTWSTAPAALVQDADGLSLARLAENGRLDRGVALDAGSAPLIAIDENDPSVAATGWEATGGALRLFDARTGRAGREVRVRAPSGLTARGNGHWLVALKDEDGRRTTVVDFDGNLDRAVPLLSSAGAVESIVAGRRWLFAIALSTAPRPAGDARWLQPRELHRVDLAGIEPALALTWTRRQGVLLGLDEPANRLFYAVTDQDDPAVWSLDLSSDSLRAAASAVDSSRPVPWSLLFMGLLAAFMITLSWAVVTGRR